MVETAAVKNSFLKSEGLFNPTSDQFFLCNLRPTHDKHTLNNNPNNSNLPDFKSKIDGMSTMIICNKMPLRVFQKDRACLVFSSFVIILITYYCSITNLI